MLRNHYETNIYLCRLDRPRAVPTRGALTLQDVVYTLDELSVSEAGRSPFTYSRRPECHPFKFLK